MRRDRPARIDQPLEVLHRQHPAVDDPDGTDRHRHVAARQVQAGRFHVEYDVRQTAQRALAERLRGGRGGEVEIVELRPRRPPALRDRCLRRLGGWQWDADQRLALALGPAPTIGAMALQHPAPVRDGLAVGKRHLQPAVEISGSDRGATPDQIQIDQPPLSLHRDRKRAHVPLARQHADEMLQQVDQRKAVDQEPVGQPSLYDLHREPGPEPPAQAGDQVAGMDLRHQPTQPAGLVERARQHGVLLGEAKGLVQHDRFEPFPLVSRQVVPARQGLGSRAQAAQHAALALDGGAQHPVAKRRLVELGARIGQGENVAAWRARVVGHERHPGPAQSSSGDGGADEAFGCRRAGRVAVQQPVEVVQDRVTRERSQKRPAEPDRLWLIQQIRGRLIEQQHLVVEVADQHALGQVEQQRLQPALLVLNPGGGRGELVADRCFGCAQPCLDGAGGQRQPPQPAPAGYGKLQRRMVTGDDREIAREPIERRGQALIHHQENTAERDEPARQRKRHRGAVVGQSEKKRGAASQGLDRQQRQEQPAQQRGCGPGRACGGCPSGQPGLPVRVRRTSSTTSRVENGLVM